MTAPPPPTRRLLLHMGAPKTGSSLLQAFFARNVAQLAARGITYPALEPLDRALSDEATSGNGALLARALMPPRHRVALSEAERAAALERFDTALAAATGDVLVSSEWFFVIPRPEQTMLAERALAHGLRLCPILYLRRQDDMIMSLYAQEVKKAGLTEDAETFCMRYAQKDRRLNYYTVLQGLTSRFPAEDCRVRIYERAQWVNGSLIDDFLSACAVDDLSGFDRRVEKINVTPGRLALEWMRLANTLPARTPVAERLMRALRRVDGREDSPGPVLPPALRLEILKRFDGSNARAAREFLGRADGRLFLTPPPDADEPWQDIAGLAQGRVISGLTAAIRSVDTAFARKR
ncbi:hypothetical protein FDP22_04675 [Paroceanicella profunda]|uniref:Sulfotransferase family protein n=1 Tax=Paroceanicella profunda TaxID=2579971 RepID=A0A5B8FR10_9RHOB|nr:hypothetical protein [Paroceanicella profunda]QDL91136.1 hypothetical protein FDP22_04675 [Paroceanicella profunda]